MKKTYNDATRFIAFLWLSFMAACTNPTQDVAPTGNTQEAQEVIYTEGVLLGERVMFLSNVPMKLFDQRTMADHKRYMEETYYKSPSARASNLHTLSVEEMARIVEKHLSKYPKFDAETMSDDDLSKIKKTFLDVRTKKDVFDKREAIFTYYNALLKSQVLPEFVEAKKKVEFPVYRILAQEKKISFRVMGYL